MPAKDPEWRGFPLYPSRSVSLPIHINSIAYSCIVRLSGGIVVICFEHKNSVGLIIAALVLLNVGVVPLIIESLGFLRLM
jgi:hypothetical protein